MSSSFLLPSYFSTLFPLFEAFTCILFGSERLKATKSHSDGLPYDSDEKNQRKMEVVTELTLVSSFVESVALTFFHFRVEESNCI